MCGFGTAGQPAVPAKAASQGGYQPTTIDEKTAILRVRTCIM